MQFLICCDLRLMLKGEPNVVQAVQQTLSDKLVDGKARAESFVVAHLALLEINRDLVVVDLLRPTHQIRSLILAQLHREESILGAVVGENVREGRGDHGAKAEVGQSPYCMFTGGSTSKILSRNQN